MKGNARLDGKVTVITGGGRGIGRAAAVQLAQAGADVAVTARTASEIEETAERVRLQDSRALAFPADVSDWSAMRRLAQVTTESLGVVDVLICNAGILSPVGDIWEVSPDEWAQNVNVNLMGVFNTVRAFLPAMVERRSGVLIFVSSGAASHPIPGWSAYCAAKAGLDHFARNLASEIDQNKLPLRVHTFYPGVVDTSMQARIREMPEQRFSGVNRYRDYHEQGTLRPPKEPATLIWWLATPMAADFHGQVVSIDDATIRNRMASDLGVPVFSARD